MPIAEDLMHHIRSLIIINIAPCTCHHFSYTVGDERNCQSKNFVTKLEYVETWSAQALATFDIERIFSLSG